VHVAAGEWGEGLRGGEMTAPTLPPLAPTSDMISEGRMAMHRSNGSAPRCIKVWEAMLSTALQDRAYSLALAQQLAAAHGYVCVPREPTVEMWTAGREPLLFRDAPFPEMMTTKPWFNADKDSAPRIPDGHAPKGSWAVWVYRAMIAAAPGVKP